MKKLLFLLSLLLSTMLVVAQSQGQRSPSLQVKNLNKGENPVKISDVKIDVKVVGSLAVTTVDLTFYNPNNRILEGDLEFPLADGQSVSRFALDINGKLREGVVIEKAKGQAVFESTIRRKVDPGLLEKTSGNNFRTRVYPLPSKGTRRVVIAYEQELRLNKGLYQFFLPIEYGDKLDNFSLNLTAFANEEAPTVDKTPWGEFAFNRSGNAYVASYTSKNYNSKGQLVFSIPAKDKTQTYIEEGKTGKDIVFYTRLFPKADLKAKPAPKRIALFWDASTSMSKRNFQLEVELLNTYFSELKNLTVDLYVFNCLLNKPQTFTIANGRWNELQAALASTPYDGATQFGILNFKNINADEALLFSDGLSTFGKYTPTMGKARVSVINSSLSADHSMSKYISMTSGGAYINLLQQTPAEGVKQLSNEKFRLISVDYNESEITDLTTSDAIFDTESGFSIAGKLMNNSATIVLNFGIGSQIIHTETVTLRSKEAKDYGNMIERVWAAKRIGNLDMLYDQNQREIEAIGRKYNIVTRNTSLIVLDDINDYVQHRITPPDDLLEEYNKIMRDRAKERQTDIEDRLDNVSRMVDNRKDWWKTDFPKKEPKPKKQKNQPRIRPSSSGGSSRVKSQSSSYNGSTVSGTIIDDTNEPLIGVSVFVKGTTRATVSDYDGNYSINAAVGEKLSFQYIGMDGIEVQVRGSALDVILGGGNDLLEEVVVVGYGTQRRSDRTSAVEFISAEKMEEQVPVDIADALQGRIAGVQVREMRDEAPILVRGASSTTTGSPLYIVDGKEFADLSSINESDIESIDVLKDANATAVYGSRASSGVIIVTTKDGAKNENKRASSGAIKLKEWNANARYMREFVAKPKDKLYAIYLSIKKDYEDTPSFYLDVANLFEKRGLKDEAFIVLSNLAEMKIEDYKLLRVLAHRLKQLGYHEYAIDIFKTVLRLRPEEPQSFRDLGLTYIENKEYQEGIDMLYAVVCQEWDSRFEDIELFAVEEINNAIAKAKYNGTKLDLKGIDERLLNDMPIDIRIVLSWDTDNSDMDLHVTDPNGEECYYSHKETKIGGLISDDFTDGYGPEVFLLKKAIKGKYKIEAHYYGSREQTLIGPTTIYLDIYTYYSSRKEKKETITLRLTEKEATLEVGEIDFK